MNADRELPGGKGQGERKDMSVQSGRPSVGKLSERLVEDLITQPTRWRVGLSSGPRGNRIVDAGAETLGSTETGIRLAEICLGGLGTVGLAPDGPSAAWPWTIHVRTSDPVLACLGSQYAGWSLVSADGKWRGLGSGPARAAAVVESLFTELGYRDQPERTALILESTTPPPDDVILDAAAAIGVTPDRLTVIYAPTASLAGSTQVVARVLEVALHKAHALGFPLLRIVDGFGAAPLPPPAPDDLTAMGRTNDAIIYGGRVHLMVRGTDEEARSLAENLPSLASRNYGAPFADVFASVGGDFYAIDPMLFSPAEAAVTCLDTGRTWRGGRIVPELLDASFA